MGGFATKELNDKYRASAEYRDTGDVSTWLILRSDRQRVRCAPPFPLEILDVSAWAPLSWDSSCPACQMMGHQQFSPTLGRILKLLELAVQEKVPEVNVMCECSSGKCASMLATALLERAIMSASLHPILRIHHSAGVGADQPLKQIQCPQCRTDRVEPCQFYMLKDVGQSFRMQEVPGGRYGLPWHEPGRPFPTQAGLDVETSSPERDLSATQA